MLPDTPGADARVGHVRRAGDQRHRRARQPEDSLGPDAARCAGLSWPVAFILAASHWHTACGDFAVVMVSGLTRPDLAFQAHRYRV